MSGDWPLTPLGECIRHRKAFIQIADDQTYKRCRVQLHAQGVVLRDVVPGAEIKTKSQQVCRSGDLLVAEIDAKVGGFGIVPRQLDGAVVSSHYFLFDVDVSRLNLDYLSYCLKTSMFRDQVAAQGSTNYAAIRPGHVLTYRIPLPKLEVQGRTVAYLDGMMNRLRSARTIQQEASEQTGRLLESLAESAMLELETSHGRTEIASLQPTVTSGPRNWGERYSDNSGFRFYRAQDLTANGAISEKAKVFVETPVTQAQAARLVPGDVLIVITGATVGRCAVFSTAHEPGMVSQHVAVCRLPQDRIAPTFVRWALLSRSGQEQLLGQRYGQGKPGLNLTNIRNVRIPVPPMDIQLATVARLDEAERQVKALRRLQAGSSVEIDALSSAVLNRAFNGAPE